MAKAHAISEFKKHFPYADISRFKAQVDFDSKRKATGEVLFPESADSWADPLLVDHKYWTPAMKDALGMHQDGGFPYQLSLTKQNSPTKLIPAVDFSKRIQTSVGDARLSSAPFVPGKPFLFFALQIPPAFPVEQHLPAFLLTDQNRGCLCPSASA